MERKIVFSYFVSLLKINKWKLKTPERWTPDTMVLPTKLRGMAIALIFFKKTDHRSNRVLWRYWKTHVHMIGHQMAFDNITLLLERHSMINFTQVAPTHPQIDLCTFSWV